ncbi:MAG: putative rane protein [Myxococcales bacterium]|nr:putative rane protein [Myxococcales bacterium]
MAKLKTKIQNALDENRMLILGVQVLIGFNFRAVFERGFEVLPRLAQLMTLGALTLLILTLALLLTPGAHHRIAEHGEDSPEFHRFTSGFACAALVPLSIGFSLDLGIAGWKAVGPIGGGMLGATAGLVALTMWFGIELIGRQTREGKPMQGKDDQKQEGVEKTKISDKIRHVLTEARVVLPGAQALLGFQFAVMLVDGFDKLPAGLRFLHLACLCSIAMATVILMTPAAWHRIVERGEETERFHRFASAMIVTALPFIALGICGDFYIVTWRVTQSVRLAAAMTATLLVVFFGLWFGLSLVRRPRVAVRHAMVARSA